MSGAVVLDASALLAALFLETGHEIVEQCLAGAAISAINYSEVVARQMRQGVSREMAVSLINSLELKIIPWDLELAEAAADLSSLAWTHGLSLGDRACLATARHLKSVALTAEKNWALLPHPGLQVRCIR